MKRVILTLVYYEMGFRLLVLGYSSNSRGKHLRRPSTLIGMLAVVYWIAQKKIKHCFRTVCESCDALHDRMSRSSTDSNDLQDWS
jgi:hypothetical protein